MLCCKNINKFPHKITCLNLFAKDLSILIRFFFVSIFIPWCCPCYFSYAYSPLSIPQCFSCRLVKNSDFGCLNFFAALFLGCTVLVIFAFIEVSLISYFPFCTFVNTCMMLLKSSVHNESPLCGIPFYTHIGIGSINVNKSHVLNIQKIFRTIRCSEFSIFNINVVNFIWIFSKIIMKIKLQYNLTSKMLILYRTPIWWCQPKVLF